LPLVLMQEIISGQILEQSKVLLLITTLNSYLFM